MGDFMDFFLSLIQLVLYFVCLYYAFILIKGYKLSVSRENLILDTLVSIDNKLDSL